MSNEVIWYDSSETGAPTLNNAAGSMLAVLDACLINGFNVKSVTSIVVASNVATVTCTGHGYSGVYGKLVKISGATPAGLNGRKQVTPTGVDSFTFPAPGISDQTATGTISARRAPLETWEKPYTGTNKAMYRSTDTGASGALLRVEDALSGNGCTAWSARVRMVASASSIDTFTNPCPTDAQLANGGFFHRGTNSAAAKKWTVIGDGRVFWLLVEVQATDSSREYGAFMFGDFQSFKAGDSSNAMLLAANNDNGGGNTVYSSGVVPSSISASGATAAYFTLLQSNNGISSSVFGVAVPTIAGLSATLFGRAGPAYPSPVDGGLLIAYPTMLQEDVQQIRGTIPGLGYAAANISSLGQLTVLNGLSNSSRVFLTHGVSTPSAVATVLFDITGPWR